MAFVNEMVPADQEFDINVFFSVPGEPIERFRWTIDRERNVFLVKLGGGGQEPGHPFRYAMSCASVIIKFIVVITESDAVPPVKEGLGPNPFDVDWDVIYFRIPEGYEARREEFLALIKEGLEAKGDRTCRGHNRLNNVKVRITNKHEKYYKNVKII